MNPTAPIKVLLVDDSPTVLALLARNLATRPDIQVVGGAKDVYEARELIFRHQPNVIILDIEMPRMDGLTFLRKLMTHYPVPVIMCSSLTQAGSEAALQAFEIGAVDAVAKPVAGTPNALQQLCEELTEKIRAAAISRPGTPPLPARAAPERLSFRSTGLDPDSYLVAIGASTGGTEAIRALLTNAPRDFPPVVMVQHMPEGFTRSFADRLDSLSALTVKEAVGGETLKSGQAFLARGGIQMHIEGRCGHWRIVYGSTERVNRHCPSVDVLFESVAKAGGNRAVGAILTGMGADGAQGLLHMRRAGALTLAQDGPSCVVYGMPKAAVELQAVQIQCPPAEIPRRIAHCLAHPQHTCQTVHS